MPAVAPKKILVLDSSSGVSRELRLARQGFRYSMTPLGFEAKALIPMSPRTHSVDSSTIAVPYKSKLFLLILCCIHYYYWCSWTFRYKNNCVNGEFKSLLLIIIIEYHAAHLPNRVWYPGIRILPTHVAKILYS